MTLVGPLEPKKDSSKLYSKIHCSFNFNSTMDYMDIN